ncbi:MAG: hypothetical protein KGD63_12440 [Candidatus Lokiarchaeota archaeon]|nr:hypothetical protein [Candidatus Lokiarchaeota archaeon]
MRHFYRSHGKHCHLRSFKSNCPKCQVDVLFWECTHGSKVFFQYPPYGKLIRHICKKGRQNERKNRFKVIVKNPREFKLIPPIQCDICGKIFKNKEGLENHMIQLSKIDYLHKSLIKRDKKFIKNISDQNLKSKNNEYFPAFGKINFKSTNK